MNYFEVLYSNCFNEKHIAIIATKHDSPEIPTIDFNFNWNGNRLIDWHATTQHNFRYNIRKYFLSRV